MTYEELAGALGSTPKRAHQIVRRNGWARHMDRSGRARASVPESFLLSWRAISVALETRVPREATQCVARRMLSKV